MNPAFDCEALFNRTAELGASVAALGEMLQWAPDEVQQRTLVALGGLLSGLGRDIGACSKEYLDKQFHQIMELQGAAVAKEGAAV